MTVWEAIKDTFGCGSRFGLHDYRWGVGPTGNSWWMFCTKCTKGVGLDMEGNPL